MARHLVIAALAWIGMLLAGGAAWPQEPAPAETGSGGAPLDEQRAALTERMAREQEAPASDERRARIDLLGRIDRTLSSQQESLARAEDLRRAAQQAAAEAPGPAGAVDDAAPTVPDLDAAYEKLQAQLQHQAELEAALTGARAALESARSDLERNETARREIQEALDEKPEASRRGQLEQALALRGLRGELRSAELELRRLEAENAETALANQQGGIEQQRAALERIQERVEPRGEHLNAALEELDKREFDLARELEAAKLDSAAAERRWTAAQKRADAAPGGEDALREQLRALRLAYTTEERRVTLLTERIERTRAAREIWRRRYAVIGGDAPYEELVRWRTESLEWLAQAGRDERLGRARLTELRQELDESRERRVSGGDQWIARQEVALEQLVGDYESDLSGLDQARRLRSRLLADLDRRVDTFDLRVQWAALRERLRRLWSYELTASEDRTITVGKVALALTVFALGLLVARLLSAALERRVLPRLRVDEGVGHAYQSLLYYFLVLVSFLVALRTVNIPLTAFAVVGGALAIGVGFGSQNIMNNFISGLILLAERPIKLGDLIDVDGTYGTVERIGLRSTSLRSGDNVHMIVPNSTFLENRVVNWTHTDPNVRICVTVGVAYGSPTRDVEAILGRVVAGHPRVNAAPPPIVLFRNFGDNSLEFEAHFWIRMRNLMDRWRTESEIRFGLDEEFRKVGIVVAFPQRDVHIDTPLDVRLRREPRDHPEEPS